MKISSSKFWLRLILISFVCWLFGSYVGARVATRTKTVAIPTGSQMFTQNVESQVLKTEDGVAIETWFLPNKNSKKAVVLLNGIGANRMGLVDRAKFYHSKNYNVLLPDLRGTGESGGDAITFGWQERWDLAACVDFLQKKEMKSIGVHGLSLGAATIAYSFQEHPDYEFVVLESCYDNITNALKNRVEKFYIPYFLFTAMSVFTEWRVGATEAQLSPEDYMKYCKYPTLVMAGDSEVKVKRSETEAIYQKCASSTKQLYFFKGARHENFLNRYESEWQEIMTKWLLDF